MSRTRAGRTLTAVSDRARWFRTRLVQDAEGRLVGVEGLTGGALKDRSGAPLEGRLSDSEAIVPTYRILEDL